MAHQDIGKLGKAAEENGSGKNLGRVQTGTAIVLLLTPLNNPEKTHRHSAR